MSITLSFVLPVGVIRVFQVPQWAAAADDRRRREVIFGRRRGRGPFERPRVPRIVAGRFAGTERAYDIDYQDEYGDALHQRSNRFDEIERVQSTPRLIGINAPRHPAQPREMHSVEGQMEADQE